MASRYPVTTYLVVANGITLIFFLLAHAMNLNAHAKLFCAYAAKFGPTLGALLTALVLAGPAGVRALLQPLWPRRGAAGWLVLAVVAPVILAVVAVAITAVSRGASLLPATGAPAALLVAFVTPIVLGGGLGEEIGWRGFMLPVLQDRMSPIRASAIVGFWWGLWHTPAFLVPSSGKSGGIMGLFLFVLLCTALSAVFTWVFNGSAGSLLVTILLHGCVNGGLDAADIAYPSVKPDLVWALLLLIIAIGLAAKTRLGGAAAVPIVGALESTRNQTNTILTA